ncbi:MAG: TRAM domain-containing protein, partial [Candidatus Hydrogenedentes bacterium]|nr:TRAM domain-containing protein [Candidatus Hydrogenedentota bacterium]
VTQDLFEKLSPAVMASALGMIAGYLLSRYVIYALQIPEETDRQKYVALLLITSFTLLLGYAGIALGLSRASSWTSLIQAVHKRQSNGANQKLVDTIVIIDGRLADICKSGFIEGTLLIPRFVLKELQNIADSSDVLRRARGRRGLDILKLIQEDTSKVSVLVIEDDPHDAQDVDGKLVRLARELGAKILTNDFNLNKVAQIEGVQVLNINDLANALKPAVLPDEQMRVKIIKEGKEAFQGVGYLDDGTMVVVDGGKEHVGKDVSVLVTSVLQTTAGRMIFTKLQSVHS